MPRKEGNTTTIMKTIGFLLLAAIVAGTLSCAKPTTKEPTNEKQPKTPYIYENDLFSVAIPNGWGVDPSEWEGLNGFKNEVEIVDFNFGDPLDGIVSLHFVKTFMPFDGRNVIEAAEMAKTARALSTDSVELIGEIDNAEVGGYPANILFFAYYVNGDTLIQKQFVTYLQDSHIVAYFNEFFYFQDWVQAQKVGDSIIATVKLKKVVNPLEDEQFFKNALEKGILTHPPREENLKRAEEIIKEASEIIKEASQNSDKEQKTYSIMPALIILFFIVCLYIVGKVGYAIGRDKRAKSDYEEADEAINAALDEEDKKPRNLLMKTLEEIGCQYSVDKDDVICFKYQGEAFEVYANNDIPYIRVYDYAWTGIKMDDPDADLLKQAVNEANCHCFITTHYTMSEETNNIVLHCCTMILFTHDLSGRKKYLEAVLSAFFTAHDAVKEAFDKLHQAREEKLKNSLTNSSYQC